MRWAVQRLFIKSTRTSRYLEWQIAQNPGVKRGMGRIILFRNRTRVSEQNQGIIPDHYLETEENGR